MDTNAMASKSCTEFDETDARGQSTDTSLPLSNANFNFLNLSLEGSEWKLIEKLMSEMVAAQSM